MIKVLRLYKTDCVVCSPHGRRIAYYEPITDTTYIKVRNDIWIQYDCGKCWNSIKETDIIITLEY